MEKFIHKSCLKYLITLVMIHICVSGTAYAETIYYKLSKKIEGGVEYTNTGGGQFITFENNKCYDSDKYGISVKNGVLKFLDIKNGNLRYTGETYWGNAFYIIKPDKSVLNVWISDNLIYVYRRMSAPSNVKTCTLIKSTPTYNGSNGMVSQSNPILYNSPNYPSKNTGKTIQPTNDNSQSQPSRQFKCAYCNGTGRIERNDNAPASFGQNRANKRCNECGKVYDPTVFTHYHQQCRHCGGTGYTK